MILFIFLIVVSLRTAFSHCHHNGITNVIRIFFDQMAQGVFIQKLGVFVLLGVFFELQHDLCAKAVLFAFGQGIPLSALGFPAISTVSTEFARAYRHGRAYHKRRIKANAELADDLYILVLVLALEIQ